MNASALPRQDRSADRDLPNGVVRPGRLRPITVSITSLRDHADCPSRWAQRRLDRGPRDPRSPAAAAAAAALVGNGVHKVLELMAEGHDLNESLRRALEGADSPSDLSPMATAEVRSEIAKLVSAAAKWAKTDPARPTLVGAEVRLGANLDGVDVAGVADAIERDADGVWSVSDYKTGDAPQAVAEDEAGNPIFEASVTRQPVLYAELAETPDRHFGRARVLYPRSETMIEVDLDTPRGRILRLESRRWVAFHTAQLHRSIAKGFFAAKPSPHRCKGCAFAATCPASAVPVSKVA